jgi:phage gpG-like protein
VSTLSIEIVALGETVVQRDLLRFGHNLVDMKPALREAGVIMRAASERQFVTEGAYADPAAFAAAGPGGSMGPAGGWMPLRGSLGDPRPQPAYAYRGSGGRVVWGYAAWKRKHYPGRKILRATGALFESLTRRFDGRHIERVSEDSLRFGTLVPYATFHQSTRPRRVMPYRPPVGLTEADKRAIVHAIQRRAMEGVRG